MLLAAASLAAETTQDLAVWSSVNGQVDLHEGRDTGPRLWTDLHFRRTDAWFVGIARPALGYDLAKGVAVYAGYAWVPWIGEATDDALQHEHRAWQQALLSRKAGSVQLGLRPRLEQRFVGGQPGTGHRLRVWGRAAAPVSKPVSLVVTDEVFVGFNATDWVVGSNVAGFDQNRLFLGAALPVAEVGRVEVGYLDTFVLRSTGNTLLHTFSTNLFLNL